eukprot:CAMPEP_0194777568 /NCGR_PEP_ID=MMETSP0323_2-20130528/65948_1 /TAXON_ID=2866 ORGANISM="Crypthecodinium cohnii, Strain Seligo" /NCGR_SAMPLE_ID=MMETSP0323_2 /ASSEMBLY_ACC=CAM_ASM_000346 /LENGTH=65 /DNA_ID=CAMNT_0039714415 /DNA_START=387 /DNA_END=582 /DNA_ORIENTATION=-
MAAAAILPATAAGQVLQAQVAMEGGEWLLLVHAVAMAARHAACATADAHATSTTNAAFTSDADAH